MAFNGITHVIQYPTGRYGLVGSVPLSCMATRVPTQADVMGGRVRNGLAYVDRSWGSVAQLIEDTRTLAPLCVLPTCACRNLFALFQEAK